jgi:kynurenine formamidase
MTSGGGRLTLEDFRRMGDKVRNWGRWGSEDQLGTLNFITEEKVVEAARLVRTGRILPLGLDINANGIWSGSSYRRNPVHLMTLDGGDSPELLRHLEGWNGPDGSVRASRWGERLAKFNDDVIFMPLQASTQWDALSHVYYDERMYNGVPASAVTSLGATRNSIDVVDVKGVVSRGVLLDVAAGMELPYLPAGTVIEPADLDSVAAHQGVTITSGDVVVVRTGWWPQFAVIGDGTVWRMTSPGLSWRCAEWLHDHEVAAVAADNVAVEAVVPDADVALPLHLLCLRDMGLLLGELWNLEALAADCASDGVYEFQLVAAPLRVTGAVGSPINPMALK